MKKKETNIATNVSSGAEKVETVEKELKEARGDGVKKTVARTKAVSAKGDAAMGDSVKEEKVDAKKTNSHINSKKAAAESKAAKERVQLALKKKEEKAKKKAEREEAKRKKLAARKEALAKREAERKERDEKRKAAREAAVRERAHQKANKKQSHARKRKERARKNEDRESRAKGYGGWIAAVVALGVTTLALATTVTVGAVEMNKTKQGMMGANRSTMYELTGVMEHIDDDLDRVRISASPIQQGRILTDLLVQARVAEADFEKLPVSLQECRNITAFVNRTAAECERMLAKLRAGEQLSAEDMEKIEGLYHTNHAIRQELNQLTEGMTEKDMTAYLKGKGGMVGEALTRLENMTLEENRAMFDAKAVPPPPQEMETTNTVDGARAAELCKQYFHKYGIEDFQCVGETSARGYTAYNVQGYDAKGTMLFAEISKADGALVGFDYYEECSAENFDVENAERIAEEFLENLGYDDMEVVRNRSMGSTVEFTFVYEDDGVVYYPDEVRVKVCRTRGVVTGMDATKYLRNHKKRDDVDVKMSLADACGKLCDKLTVESSRVAVVRVPKGERVAYEMLCKYEDGYYFVYLDGETGEEIAIINAQKVF